MLVKIMKGDEVKLSQRDAIFMQTDKFTYKAAQYECVLQVVPVHHQPNLLRVTVYYYSETSLMPHHLLHIHVICRVKSFSETK